MKGILADANITGHVGLLVARMQAEPWKLFWDHLQLRYVLFSEVGLASETPDEIVWRTCQAEELYLITDNRTRAGQESLEACIRAYNTPTSLPVFTISNARRFRQSREFADRVAESLFQYLVQGENILGTGRLYLP